VIAWLLALSTALQAAQSTYSIRAVVSDAKGAPVRDLLAGDVSLAEDRATLQVTSFEKDDRPVQMALLIDSSQPVASAYRLQFIAAAKALIASLPETTRLSVWTTGDRPVKVIDDLKLGEYGASRDIASRLGRVAPVGGNTILDALVEAAEDLRKKEGDRRVVVFLSGMGPGFANNHRQALVDRVMKTDVEVAGVLISEKGDPSGGGELSEEDYDFVFGALTNGTAGRLERTLSAMGASAALQRVAADLRWTYRLSYLQTKDSRQSRIALQVARPSVKVRLSAPRKETSSP
jgi:hypothetical protein